MFFPTIYRSIQDIIALDPQIPLVPEEDDL